LSQRSQEQQGYATSRLNDPGWITYCARRYRSFDPYTGTYLGDDGLRHAAELTRSVDVGATPDFCLRAA
jgi:hypothetical protein